MRMPRQSAAILCAALCAVAGLALGLLFAQPRLGLARSPAAPVTPQILSTPAPITGAGRVTLTLAVRGVTLAPVAPSSIQVSDQAGLPVSLIDSSVMSRPITVAFLIDSVAGDPAPTTSIITQAIKQVVDSLQPDDRLAISSTAGAEGATSIVFRPAKMADWGATLSAALQAVQITDALDKGSDAYYANLLRAAPTVCGDDSLVVLFTNGADLPNDVTDRGKLNGPAVLVELDNIPNGGFNRSARSSRIAQSYRDAGDAIGIHERDLVSQLKERAARVRVHLLTLSFPESLAAGKYRLSVGRQPIGSFDLPSLAKTGSGTGQNTAPGNTVDPAPAAPRAPTSTAAPTATPTPTAATPKAAAPASAFPAGAAIAVVLVLALVVAGAAAFAIRAGRLRTPYLIIADRRVALTQAMYIGSEQFPDDVLLEPAYARLRPEYGGWVIEAAPPRFLWVDGLRSRRNRLRDGAIVALGPTRVSTFQFFDPQAARRPGAPGGQP